jgi:hypothetical protein
MAVSAHFQNEINEVDPTKTLVYVLNTTTYDDFEWSYNGLTITGGSDLACEYGASELMEEMGFRWYMPETAANDHFTVRPVSIPTNLTAAKQSFWIQNNRIFLVYEHKWADNHTASRTELENSQAKWERLNGWQVSAYPAGHRWDGIISNNQPFFTAHPELTKDSDPTRSFDLSITGADMELLEDVCAAYLLQSGFNEWGRTNFDPQDGDSHTSDQVFTFASRVAMKIRAGTAAIPAEGTWPGIPAQTGIPDAEIGVYAYAGHRLPPTEACPGVYSQVALNYNDTALSYTELVVGHGEQADGVSIREYLDSQVITDSKPLINTRAKEGYYERYNTFVSIGAEATVSEFGANWFANLVQARCGIRKFKTGSYTFAEALADVVTDVFDGDPAVEELLDYWFDPAETYHVYSLARSFDLVDEMAEGWYKEFFKWYMVILYKQMRLPEKTAKTAQPDPWDYATATVTISNASPAVVGWAAHGMEAEDTVVFRSTEVLPEPIVSSKTPANGDTVYYVQAAGLTANAFRISADPGGADVNTTTDGSGVFTARSRSPRICPKWTPLTVYVAGDWVTNNNWKYYECTVGGTSAASGGPTGGAQAAQTDGTVTWQNGRGGSGKVPPSSTVPVPAGMEDDPFQTAFTSLMKNVVAVRDYNIIHSYAWVRQEANSAVGGSGSYPWLAFQQSQASNDPLSSNTKLCVYYPLPEWFQNPELPTEQEWLDSYTAISLATARDPVLDTEDLAIVRGITPEAGVGSTPASMFFTRLSGSAQPSYVFVGPGKVTTTTVDSSGSIFSGTVVNTETYGAGAHTIPLRNNYRVTCQGGELFLDTFPLTYIHPDGTGLSHWLYIPTRFAGEVNLEAGSRWRFVDADGQFDLLPATHADYVDPATLGPGQIRVENNNTSGVFRNLNVNRYLGMKPDVALMPDEIAMEDFPGRPKINVV